MRRKDKEITNPELITEIIENNFICRIALSENNQPYIIPMNYGYRINTIYLHCAPKGKKLDIISKNSRVCFEITDSIEIVKAEKACGYGTRFRSVIGFGTIMQINDPAQKAEALRIIMKQHSGKEDWDITEYSADKLGILEIKIESVTGKISGIEKS